MKTFALLGVLAAAMCVTEGCATPGYSPQERDSLIARNWDYEGKQAVDQWDHFWLLRPANRLTAWNVYSTE